MIARVMIVDDDATIRRALSSVLARGGFDVCTASDGGPAVRLARVAPPEIVIVDYNMPTGGTFVVRELRKQLGEGVYIAILTGSDTPAVRRACLDAGADAVLTKPISPTELRRRLTAAMENLRDVS